MMSPTPCDPRAPRRPGRARRAAALLAAFALTSACQRTEKTAGFASSARPGTGDSGAALPSAPTPATAPGSAPLPGAESADDPAAGANVKLPAPILPPEQRPGDESPGAICGDYGVPCPTELVHLCGRRELLPGSARLWWDAFASDQLMEEMAAFFRGRLGERGLSEGTDGLVWTLPGSAGPSSRQLQVVAPGSPGRHAVCDTRPPASARSVLVMSREE